MTKFQLYVDDSGTRNPDHPSTERSDGMDHFALGGILVDAASLPDVYRKYGAFAERWKLTYPLHSTKIRGRRGDYRWIGVDNEAACAFYAELENLLLSIDAVGLACVIDRSGYNARYRGLYGPARWLMCKTAYCILVERAVKFAMKSQATLEVFYESVGKVEDRAIEGYAADLKKIGMPFNSNTSAVYGALRAADFKRVILGDPQRRTKRSPLIQLADMYLYPIAKSGYDPFYSPFVKLLEAGRIINARLDADEIATLGLKYSCFDTTIKTKARIAPGFRLAKANPGAMPTSRLWRFSTGNARAAPQAARYCHHEGNHSRCQPETATGTNPAELRRCRSLGKSVFPLT